MRFIFTGKYFLIFYVLFIYKLYVLFIYKLYVLCVYAYTLCHSTCVEVRAQLMGVISSFLLCGAWQQALLPPEPFWAPQLAFLYVLTIYMHIYLFF